jgi:signal transduction histidine kinase
VSFRKKIIISQIVSLMIFLAALFPFIEKIASILIKDSLVESTADLKDLLKKAVTEQELIQLLKQQECYTFFRMSIINDEGVVIFDTHLWHLIGNEFKTFYMTPQPEIKQALNKGIGYVIAKSDTFRGRFAYIAETFQFQGKTYILRTSFPYQQIENLTENFQIGILILSFLLLVFFNALILFIFNRLTRPIREMTRAIRRVQTESESQIPEIILTKATKTPDEFQSLVDTFNALSYRIQEKIDDLRGERNEKEAILESLGEGVVAVNEVMETLYINQTASKMLGVVRSEIMNHPFEAKFAKVNKELMKKAIDLLLRCQREKTIVTDSFSFGEERTIFIDLVAAPKDWGKGAIIVLQDKTQRYRVVSMGKDFIANASHELRTPITIIKGYAETLHDFSDLPKERYSEITDKITCNCERMETLIRSLLTLTDIENMPDYRCVETELTTLLTNCRHILRSIYSDAKVKINSTERKVLIQADPGLLELALVNLLDNAAKYSESTAQITITLSLIANVHAMIQITDRGRGIPKEDILNIFQRFYRVDKTHSRRLGGAGLGLSIVKTIISKHGGSIEVESVLGQGTTFTIILPMNMT